MTTRDQLLALLWENADSYLSGTEAARQLGVSRTAVWKAIDQLKTEGYRIESVTNRGYRLSSCSDVLSEAGIGKYTVPEIGVVYLDVADSTNNVAKKLAEQGAPEGTLVVADRQTGGKGRMGRGFYSPPGTGLYMSLILRPHGPAAGNVWMTAAAAVATAEGIEEISGKKTGIKWVNDVLVDGKKVVGILSEGALDCETGTMNYVVVGIGINTCTPPGGFPEEIRSVAGAVFPQSGMVPELRCRLAAAVMNRLLQYSRSPGEFLHAAYISRSTVLGRNINIISQGEIIGTGLVTDIDNEFALIVKKPDGETVRINTGEVSIRPAE